MPRHAEKYPTWRYHKEHPPIIVKDEYEDEAKTPARGGWVDSPAKVNDFKDRRPEPKVEPKPELHPNPATTDTTGWGDTSRNILNTGVHPEDPKKHPRK